jgi:hypothetical protein
MRKGGPAGITGSNTDHTEGAYLALGNAVLKKVEQGRVGEILGCSFVKEPDVDVIGFQGSETGIERGPGSVGSKDLSLRRLSRSLHRYLCGSCKTFFCRGELADDGSGNRSRQTEERTILRWSDAVLGSYGDVGRMPSEKFAEAALCLSIAIHGSNIEMTDAVVVRGFKHGQ